ncbi:hypothetical protein ABL78_2942 [Leptomonas seymouri]|uniref:Uncharacterized protein n=1 Tax=Leptomonas seymouri TaxID=5684 RepID=A0A0N1PDV9_LEPSE|nr:hypothetical protein ABL78_2942 [Leptomonas seymouri]|eukprot:KPI87951.1 hypothetical protein ABL78_2942 [Leptomonas seymouri]
MKAAVNSRSGASSSRTEPHTTRPVPVCPPTFNESPSEPAPLAHTTTSTTHLSSSRKAPSTADSTHTAAAPRKAARRLAASPNDPHQWILALEQQSAFAETPTSAATDNERGGDGGAHKDRSGERTDRNSDDREMHAGAGASHPPLEERIGLKELQSIMLAFRQTSHPQDPMLPPVAPAQPETAKAAVPTPGQKAPYFAAADDRSSLDGTLFLAGPLTTTMTKFLATERDAVSPSENLHDGAGMGEGYEEPVAQLRNLSRDEFIQVLQRAIPSATLPEIHALLAKAISDNQDCVSWNELATFLVTCSRQKDDLAIDDQRFVLSGRPNNLHFEEQHSESITCVAVNRQRHLIVTGCSGGSVRAWSSGGDLDYRGMLLKVDGWIVGLHWGCRGRVLYVITMDRYVYVLDGTTFEVLHVFHGRGIKGTANSMTYAAETISKMHVGGVALPKHRSPQERGYASVRLRAPSAKGRVSSATAQGGPGRGKLESNEERMQRLLSSAIQVRRGMQSHPGDEPIGAGIAGCADAPARIPDLGVKTTEASNAPTLATSYSITTASAAEALHQDNTPLTGAGRGPYIVQRVDEGVLMSLVDAVTATAFGESAFQEDVLLLGTSKGDAFLFTLAMQNDLTQRQVLAARHVFAQLHDGPVTKLEFSHSLNALISSGEDGRVLVTSLISGQSLRAFYSPELPEQHSSVTDFALHPQLKMLLTIGPERRALLWEWNQPSPIAVLESVNRPLCCCAFLGEQLLTVSRDRVLHVYDCKSFRLRQELPLGSAGTLTRFSEVPGSGASAAAAATLSSSSASSCMTTQLYADPIRQRVIGFGRFPFALCVKRQVSSGCPARYRGHHAPMFTTLSSRAFGQLVTVGTDGVIMTWTPRNGVNEFSFLLSNFSNASATTGAPEPPVAASMDVLQRRLLTGFAGGVMVAWNVLNGQVERVLTAATAFSSSSINASSPPTTSLGNNTKASGGVSSASSLSRTAAATAPKGDVTAVGSFLRHHSLSYLFASGRILYIDASTANSNSNAAHTGEGGPPSDPQLGEYTTAYPSSWTPLPTYGEITQLLQLSSQHVGCGTSSGAVLVYNVLSDCQEGAPLWVSEEMLYPLTHGTVPLTLSPASPLRGGTASLAGTMRCRSMSGRREGGGGRGGGGLERQPSLLQPIQNSAAGSANNDEAAGGVRSISGLRGHVFARTVSMLTLPAVHPRLLVVAQEDGTLSFWHTLRRVCIGAVSLAAPGLLEDGVGRGDDGLQHREDGLPGTFVFDMDEEEGKLLVFGDGEGNVHVCRVDWHVLTQSSEQVAAMSLPNPLLYTLTATASSSATYSLSLDQKGKGAGQEGEHTPSSPTAATLQDTNEAQRSIPLLRQLERVHVFSSGLALTGLRIVDAAAATAFDPAGAAAAAARSEAAQLDRAQHVPADASAPSHQLLIVCTGTDHYVRVFTLSGVPIGELGMDRWNMADPRTYRFVGEPVGVPAAPLPCSARGNPTWQHDAKDVVESSPCYFNYLADLYTTHFPRSNLSIASRHASMRHSERRSSIGILSQTRRSATDRAAQSLQLDTLSAPSLERVLSPSAMQQCVSPTEKRAPSLSPTRRSTTTLHAALLRAEATAGDERRALVDDGLPGSMEREKGGEYACCPSPPTPPNARSLSTRLRRSTRYRCASNPPPQHGVVKPSCVDAVLLCASTSAAQGQPPHGKADGLSITASPQSIFFGRKDVDWVEREQLMSSPPTDPPPPFNSVDMDTVNPLSMEGKAARDTHLSSSETNTTRKTSLLLSGSSDAGAPRQVADELLCGSVSASHGVSVPARVTNSRLSMGPGPRNKSGALSASSMASEKPLSESLSRKVNEDAAEYPLSMLACYFENSAANNTALTSPERRHRPLFPSLPPQVSCGGSGNTNGSPSSSVPAETREKRSALASPTLQRNFSLRVPSTATVTAQRDSPSDGVDRRSTKQSSHMQHNNSDLNVFSLLSRERKRLMESTRTPAVRDQLSSLAMPTFFSPAQAAAAARDPSKGATACLSASATPAGSVQQHIDSLLERRRTQHVCGVPPDVEMSKSAEGYVARLTAKMYVAPLGMTKLPVLAKRSESPSPAPHSRPQPHSPLNQTM